MIFALAFIVAAAAADFTAQRFANLPLTSAEDSAVQHSPEVALADARVRESAAALSAARGSFGPALTATYTQSPQAGGNGQTITQHFTTLGAQSTIGDLLNYSPAVAQAAANLRGAEFDLAAAQHAERIKLIGLYYDALRSVATAHTRADALHANQEDRRAADLRFSAGDAPHLDVVRADVAVARATADAENANAVQANAIEALAVETGAPSGLLDGGVVAVPGVVSSALPGSVEEAVGKALLRRPEIASAESAVRAQSASVRAAERSVLPVLTVTGGYTRGIDTGIAVAGPSANAQLTFPLSGAAFARANGERAKLAQAEARLASVQRSVRLEVGAAIRTFAANGRALRAAQEALRQAQAELQAVTPGYRGGASSSLEVTNARQTYVQAVLDELSARYAHEQAAATLELLIGS
ncbi:MAG: hypothetical protein NVSMB31_00980 [Vulcanimicrobiaceae bacterium]